MWAAAHRRNGGRACHSQCLTVLAAVTAHDGGNVAVVCGGGGCGGRGSGNGGGYGRGALLLPSVAAPKRD